VAKRSTADGVRGIMGDDGHGWLPGDRGRWIRVERGVTYALEKRRRNPKDGTTHAGWYLYGDQPGTPFGEGCGSRILEAVDEANRVISEVETPS
jgi:hypothetical protein